MRRMLAILSLVAFTPAFADQAAAPDKPAEKPICVRDAPATGSTLPGKRICKTAAEWKAQEAAQQRNATPAVLPTGMQQQPLTH